MSEMFAVEVILNKLINTTHSSGFLAPFHIQHDNVDAPTLSVYNPDQRQAIRSALMYSIEFQAISIRFIIARRTDGTLMNGIEKRPMKNRADI